MALLLKANELLGLISLDDAIDAVQRASGPHAA